MSTPHFPIYMDYSATTPVDPRVADKMIPYLREQFGNPASRSHAYGWDAERAVEEAREQVAALVGADPREIVWTSGATESDNLAIKGAANFYSGKGKHIITVKTEHKAVLDTTRELERQGFEVTYLDVKENGLLDMDVFKQALRPDTILVSVMLVNNEIGVIQDVEQIGEICREKGIIFHCDAAQATGKVAIDLNKLKCDLMSFSAHKTYGPKGIGALYVRRKPRVRIEAQMHGGGHERGMRSGTLATHQIVGMGEAFRIAREEMATENERIRMLRDRLWNGLSDMEEVYLNGDLEHRVPHNLNVSFNFVEGESLIMAIKDVAVSSGSACTSASLEPSYVLRALGRNDELAHSSIRFTVGRFTTEQEIDYTVELLKSKIGKLRDLSPLWEMFKDGVDLNSIQWAAH
ncbi:cysteine desulfurase (tRNA sulfurtransferase), PLP-dependent [Cupriavidus taiwanensis LMG 19424]|uniref:Cysteine desulfurase IscS n=3 Tax=Cupriavidus taiwanensis TaxID=164546 RepID=B3R4B2_CUPTR|nr:cysteine desulfurase (tRNA sulfurtransferase), PLP-dependent [Cupriavidus taiwanensis LMG 19424]SOY58030.1 cysteine desulfurase (tRNA sulfurtransferase), PLP-dependent [Cupriavidus taiwanensis]SOY85943.1 cysteine desulfurase (tRNA sulfurtransferase), PLP-dependent [Cupriavidus taiwanensis]SOZ02068.1 cysteine desulfurase (tRNA sulfurtransferase), PLP-dependent [Cupriavidus taiwanensis]SOZ05056.1 cysteine desulfurase (tRNA sulfurtransferase), PLP-dependent [Cupriavidus taiwanensis]